MQKIWIGEAAELLGVSISTAKLWCDRLGIANDRDNRGRRTVDSDEMKMLELAKTLRDDGSGLSTITRRVSQSSNDQPSIDEQPLDDRLTVDDRSPHFDVETLSERLIDAVKQQTDLAEKYARAAHEIGKLEERCENLNLLLTDRDQRINELTRKVALLEAPKRPWWRFW